MKIETSIANTLTYSAIFISIVSIYRGNNDQPTVAILGIASICLSFFAVYLMGRRHQREDQ